MKIFKLIGAVLLLGLSSTAFAGDTCGAGLITHIKEGGWNNNDFAIKIDYSAETDAVGGTYGSGWIRFKPTLDADRFKGIKALAYMAFSGGRIVRAFTNGSACDGATELSIYAPGAVFPG